MKLEEEGKDVIVEIDEEKEITDEEVMAELEAMADYVTIDGKSVRVEKARKDVMPEAVEKEEQTLEEQKEIIKPRREQKRRDPEEIKKNNKKETYNHIDCYNPYREESTIHLGDVKKSYRWIETEVLLKLIKSKISSSEWSIFFYILDVTRGICNKNGFYRTIAVIEPEEFQKWTNLSESTVRRTISSLKKRKMIYEVEITRNRKSRYFNESDDIKVKVIGINFRCDTWV